MRQDPVVGQPEVDPEERSAQEEQERDHGRRDRHRPTHHEGGDPVPHALPHLFGRPVPQDEPVDARPERGQERRQEQDRADQRQRDHGDPGIGERTEEEEREDQQGGQRDGHRERAEQHGPPGRVHGPDHGVVSSESVPDLLPVPRHDEQAVVDPQPDPQGGRQVQREDRHAGEQRDELEHQERPHDGERSHSQRQPGRDHAPEHQHQQNQDDGKGDRLGLAQVLLDLGPDLPEHLGLPADGDGDRSV